VTRQRASRLALQFTLLFAFWLILSGKLEVKYLVFGLASAALVTFITQDLLPPQGRPGSKKPAGAASLFKAGWKLLCYFAWLVYSIVQANLQVAYIVLHPKLPIEPGLLRFRTRLRSEVGHTILANSITLTPGTITVDLTEGTYLVHALVPEAARSLLEAKMQSRLEAIFGEPQEPQPEIRWVQEEEKRS
jgi:multicomponent Na+:H+ antiporter subunit E